MKQVLPEPTVERISPPVKRRFVESLPFAAAEITYKKPNSNLKRMA